MASCRPVWLAPQAMAWLRPRRHGAGQAPRARSRTGGAPPCPPEVLFPCGSDAGPSPSTLPAHRRAAHDASSRSWVQVQDHGTSAAVLTGGARGARWGHRLLAGGRQHAPSRRTWRWGLVRRCWGHMMGTSRVRRSVARFVLSLAASASSPGAALVYASNSCARAAARCACALVGETKPG
jgi:hypothetical protein